MSDNYDGPQMAQKIMRQRAEIERLRDWQRRAVMVINELYTEGRFGAADDLLAEAHHE